MAASSFGKVVSSTFANLDLSLGGPLPVFKYLAN